MQITVHQSEKVWSSPDGQVAIWAIRTPEGEVHKTYSGAIGTAPQGKTFNVEEYTKDTKKGPAKFLRIKKDQGGSKTYASYTREEYEDLYLHAFEFAKSLVGDKDTEALSRLMATYIIGAKDCGIKVKEAADAPTALQAKDRERDSIPQQELDDISDFFDEHRE